MNEEMRRSYPCDEKPEGAAARRRYPFEEPKADFGRETHSEPQGPERRGKGKRGGNSAMSVVKAVLSDAKLWGSDLSCDVDLTALTAKLTHAVITDGVLPTMQALLEQN